MCGLLAVILSISSPRLILRRRTTPKLNQCLLKNTLTAVLGMFPITYRHLYRDFTQINYCALQQDHNYNWKSTGKAQTSA